RERMTFNGYHHIGLWVKDPKKSLDFYTKGLGGKVVFSFPMADKPETINLVDLGGGAVVEIIPRGNGEEESNAHWAHVALRTDDARAAYDLAIGAGAVSRTEPKDNMLGTMAVCNAFVLGPDHEVIEFFQVKAQ
ncbi:MAG: VOC family protein, partial [Treponema sp.]|nr:VOC family protein [Treponema sp.]